MEAYQIEPLPYGHHLAPVPDTEGLAWCPLCNCGEGSLPTSCPEVKVPYNVQTMIHKGVVDFVRGRWVGGNRPSARVARSFREATLSLARLANTSRAARMWFTTFGQLTGLQQKLAMERATIRARQALKPSDER